MDSWDSKLEGAQKHGQKEKSSVGPRPVRHILLKIAVTLLFFIRKGVRRRVRLGVRLKADLRLENLH